MALIHRPTPPPEAAELYSFSEQLAGLTPLRPGSCLRLLRTDVSLCWGVNLDQSGMGNVLVNRLQLDDRAPVQASLL